MAKKKRKEIPPSLAAKVLFLSDRTCCVCHTKDKPVQIHHIDDDPSNNIFKNLAVLCFDCHTETMVSGGFHRKLDGEQVILYRDNWLVKVATSRTNDVETYIESNLQIDKTDIELATSISEIYREKEEYLLLAIHYMVYSNVELRDKYIELAVAKGLDDEELIYLRHEQGQIDKVPKEIIERQISVLEREENYSSLARLYRHLGDLVNSVKSTCKYILNTFEKDRIFSAAFYLKEMVTEGDIEALFMKALEKAKAEGDLWWQYRALQELEWYPEARKFILQNKESIEKSENLFLLQALAAAESDWDGYVELRKKMAQSVCKKEVH